MRRTRAGAGGILGRRLCGGAGPEHPRGAPAQLAAAHRLGCRGARRIDCMTCGVKPHVKVEVGVVRRGSYAKQTVVGVRRNECRAGRRDALGSRGNHQ